MKKDITYEEAMEALQIILQDLEDNAIPVDQLADKVKESQDLLAFCKNKLRGVEEEVEKLNG